MNNLQTHILRVVTWSFALGFSFCVFLLSFILDFGTQLQILILLAMAIMALFPFRDSGEKLKNFVDKNTISDKVDAR